jgi:ATP-dependent DNA ligase
LVGPNGLTDFEALRRSGSGDAAVLYAFDLVELDGSDLRCMPLETRKAVEAVERDPVERAHSATISKLHIQSDRPLDLGGRSQRCKRDNPEFATAGD